MSEEQAYSSSRSGAIASRGFGFQHAVAAWLCAKVVSGDLRAIEVVPEGLEDTQISGDAPIFIQAKSRQASQGDFRIGEVLGFLGKMIDARARHPRDPSSERLVLVLERGVKGAQSMQWDQFLVDLPPTDPLRVGAEGLLDVIVDSRASLATLLSRTAVVVLPWSQLDAETRTSLANASGLPLSTTEPLMHTLREEVSRCTSQNASPTLAERQTLSRQSIQRLVTETAQLIDIEALQTSLSTGRCVPVDFDTSIDDPRFYEGIDVRPGHIAAGLAAPRTDLVEFTSDALRSQHAVLVTGPSGVGKSTVMWSTAHSMRDVLWYELVRLERDDVEDIWRLLVALKPTPSSPIGLAIDSVGTKDPTAWDALRDRLPADGSVLLLGSTRTEDLSMLTTAGSAAVIECKMDESVARELFEGLQSQGRTALQIWEDAYQASNSLTMEYTYLLTHGHRMSAVLGEQIQRREREHRSIELEVLGLVSTASRWGARVPSDALLAIAPDAGPRREALRRLVGEHLIVLEGAYYGGLHQLRSSVISSALHTIPPPRLETTIAKLVRAVDPLDLRVLAVGSLFEQPELAPTLVESLHERCQGAGCPLLTTTLHALRTADFRRDGRAWAVILDANGVPQAMRPVAVWLALTDSDTEIRGEDWLPEIGTSVLQMKAAPQLPRWRNDFIAALGTDAVLQAVEAADSLQHVENLLSALQGADGAVQLAAAIVELPQTDRLVLQAPPDAASRFMGLLGAFAPIAAKDLRERLGSDTWARSILFTLHPWIVEASSRTDETEDLEIEATLLYGGDWFEIDPHQQAVDAARTLLNLYPECTAKVRTTNAVGEPLKIGDYDMGYSELRRKYNPHPLVIRWNRERARLALELATHRSDAERARVVPSLMVQVDEFLSDLTSAWARQKVNRARAHQFDEVRQRLIETNNSLAGHSWSDTMLSDVGERSDSSQALLATDDLHYLVDAICSNLPIRLLSGDEYNTLAVYVGDNTLSHVPKVKLSERWHSFPKAATALDSIEQTLRGLHVVLAEIAYGGESPHVVLAAGSSGDSSSALSRCAEKAIQRASDRIRRRLDDIVSEAAAMGTKLRWMMRDDPSSTATVWPPVEVALVIDIPSMEEWEASLTAVDQILGAEEQYIDLNFPLLVPAVMGHPIVTLAMRRGSILYPAGESAAVWRPDLDDPIPTPTLDALVRLWVTLQAMSSLRLRARLRGESDTLDKRPDDLLTQMRAAAGEVRRHVDGSPLAEQWEAWQVEVIGAVMSEISRPASDSVEVSFTGSVGNGNSPSEPLVSYLVLCAKFLEYDLERFRQKTSSLT